MLFLRLLQEIQERPRRAGGAQSSKRRGAKLGSLQIASCQTSVLQSKASKIELIKKQRLTKATGLVQWMLPDVP